MKELLLRAWPAAWPAAQFVAQLTDFDFLQRLDLLKGFLGALPHLVAFLGFCIFLITSSLYLVTYPADEARVNRVRKWVFFVVPLLFLISLNLLIKVPDTAFWSGLTMWRLSITLIAYLSLFWGLGILLAGSNLGAAIRKSR